MRYLWTEKKVKHSISKCYILYYYGYFLCSSFLHFPNFPQRACNHNQKYSNLHFKTRNTSCLPFSSSLPSATLAVYGVEFRLFTRFIFQTRSYTLLCLVPSHFPCVKSFCCCWQQLPSHSSPLHRGKIRFIGLGWKILRCPRLTQLAKAMDGGGGGQSIWCKTRQRHNLNPHKCLCHLPFRSCPGPSCSQFPASEATQK